jgi:hypothetical protein
MTKKLKIILRERFFTFDRQALVKLLVYIREKFPCKLKNGEGRERIKQAKKNEKAKKEERENLTTHFLELLKK